MNGLIKISSIDCEVFKIENSYLTLLTFLYVLNIMTIY
jgi:hypothetical protein